jgi:hypothetical protein
VAGSTIIGLTSTTGIDAGAQYIIRNDVHCELVKVLTVDSATQVTLVEGLNFDYSDGDRFRSEFYWPARLLDNDPVILERPPLHYDVELSFAEDLNDL